RRRWNIRSTFASRPVGAGCTSIHQDETNASTGEAAVAGMCEGRVCIVTGAGRGIGREHALMLAEQGAKVVVNDLGGEMDGTGTPTTGPALDVVEEIKGMGGEAVANGDDVSDFDGAARLINTAV